MRTFTVVTRTDSTPLTGELALLEAPVGTAEPSAPDEHVGRVEGVMLDEQGHVVAWIVRLAPRLAGDRPPWTLIPTAAMQRTERGGLLATWGEDQLLAQPRLDSHFEPHNRVDGGAPVESQWMPARPNVVPPGTGVNKPEAIKEGAAGAAMGAALGAIAGFVAAGPLGAAALGVFFAAGGSLAGLISGGGQETAVQAGELDVDTLAASDQPVVATWTRNLEDALRTPGALAAARLNSTQFDLVTSAGEPPHRMAS